MKNGERSVMIEDKKVIYSPLCRDVTRDGITVEICIYRLEDTEWSLSVDDEAGGSTVWDDLFASDEDALREAMQSIEDSGISSFGSKKH